MIEHMGAEVHTASTCGGLVLASRAYTVQGGPASIQASLAGGV